MAPQTTSHRTSRRTSVAAAPFDLQGLEARRLLSGATAAAALDPQPAGATADLVESQSTATAVTSATSASTAAATWQTALAYQYEPGRTATLYAVAEDAAGNAFAVGEARDAANVPHAVVLRRAAGSAGWAVADDAVGPAGQGGQYLDVAVDAAGRVFAAGNVRETNASGTLVQRWFIRRSDDGGATWATAYLSPAAPSFNHQVKALATDAQGRLYAAGAEVARVVVRNKASDVMHWVVRRSDDGGATWSDLDRYQEGSAAAFARDLAVTPSGIYAVGEAAGSWMVRRSLDGGQTWATVDRYKPSKSAGATAGGVAVDPSGSGVYVVGSADAGSTTRWLVRRSGDGASGWATVDALGSSGLYSHAQKVVAGPSGVFVVGQADERYVLRAAPAGGSGPWQTVDVGGTGNGAGRGVFAAADGTLYTAGSGYDPSGPGTHGLVRELAPAAAAAALAATTTTTTSSDATALAWPSDAGPGSIFGDDAIAEDADPLLA